MCCQINTLSILYWENKTVFAKRFPPPQYKVVVVKGQIRVNLTPQPCAHKQHLTEKKATRGTEYSSEEKKTHQQHLYV